MLHQRLKRSKVPGALLTADLGGLAAGGGFRKENFLHQSRRFLSDLGADLGLHGRVEVEVGERLSSGRALLKSTELVVELSEPPTRDGVRVSCTFPGDPVQVSPALVEPVAPLADADALQDFIYRVKRMLREHAAESTRKTGHHDGH